MRNKLNVLVTGAGSSNAIAVFKALRQQKTMPVSLFGTDTNARTLCAGAYFCDYFFTVPPACDKNYIKRMHALCKQNAVDVVIPIIDEELLVLARYRYLFEQIKTKLLLSGYAALRICLDKQRTFLFLKDNDIPTPQTTCSITAATKFPVLAKPRTGRGSRGIVLLRNKKEGRAFIGKNQAYIYQKFIKGKEYTIDAVVDMDGELIIAVPRLRIETKAGVCSKGMTVSNKTMVSFVRMICRKLCLVSLINIQCIVDAKGRIYFTEINPRASSALPLSLAAGVNLPLIALQSFLGKKFSRAKISYRPGVRMLRYWEEIVLTQ